MMASTTAFITAVTGTVLTEGQNAIVSLLTSYTGVFLTLVVGVTLIGAIVALVKRTPHAIFGSSKK
jgi:hypothetical protein